MEEGSDAYYEYHSDEQHQIMLNREYIEEVGYTDDADPYRIGRDFHDGRKNTLGKQPAYLYQTGCGGKDGVHEKCVSGFEWYGIDEFCHITTAFQYGEADF